MFTFGKAVLVGTALFTFLSAQERRTGTQQQQPARTSARSEAPKDKGSSSGNNRPYYDSRNRDWHQWDDREEQSYSRYAGEHHQKDHDFSQSNEREQQQYWKWRHKHPDEHR